MKPVMYGYLRVRPDMDDQAVTNAGKQLAALAHDEGFELGQVFLEHDDSASDVWPLVASHCLEDGVHDVVVLDVAELFHEGKGVDILRELIGEIIDGRVWSVKETTAARMKAAGQPGAS